MDKPLDSTPIALPVKPPGLSPSTIFWLLFIVAALAVLLAGKTLGLSAAEVQTLNISFLSIVLEALPFVMLGALVGGVLEVFVSRDMMTRLLPKNRMLAIGVAGMLGILIPVCECAVIAVTRRLVRKGVPFSVAVGYLLAGPIVNPIVAASTWVAFPGNWEIVVLRMVCGYGIAVLIALMMDLLFSGSRALLPNVVNSEQHAHTHHHEHDHNCDHHHEHAAPSFSARVGHALGHAADDFLQISQYLIVGAFFAGLCQTFIARAWMNDFTDTSGAAIGSMMGLAVALNLCSEADAFVAAAYRSVMPPAAMLAFMVLGPMLDIKLIAMYLSFVRKRALMTLIILLCVSVFILMQFVHALYGPTLLGGRA